MRNEKHRGKSVYEGIWLFSVGFGLMSLVAILAVSGCKVDPTFGGESVSCETDEDCTERFGDAFECHDGGFCVNTEEPSQPCTTDDDCDVGYECQDGACGRVCDPSCLDGYCLDGECICEEGCPEGEECQLGVCGAPCDPPCRGGYCLEGECICKTECPDGFECQLGQCGRECEPPCHHGYCLDGECECFEECGDDEECRDGRCVPADCDVDCHLNDECRLNEDGEWYCEPGELSVTIDVPDVEENPWVPAGNPYEYRVEGYVLWIDDGGELEVDCEHGDHSVPAIVERGSEQRIEGVTHTEWGCRLDLSQEEGGELDIRVEASGDGRDGAASVTVLRDEDEPRFEFLKVQTEESTDKVYIPQAITVLIDVEDHLTPSSTDADGKVESVEVVVNHKEHEQLELHSGELSEEQCDGLGTAAAQCALEIELEPDRYLDDEDRIEDGEYEVSVTVTDAAGNERVRSIDFEVDRTPEIWVDVFVLGDPAFESDLCMAEPCPTVIRRDERFRIELGLTRPEQVASVDGEPVTPLVELKEARFQDGACHGDLELELDGESADGTWGGELSAMDVCLPSDEKLYRIAVLIEDVWTFDPGDLKEIEPEDCSEGHFADEDDNLHCEPVEVTRHMWRSKDLCGDYSDDCTVLTPAVQEGGQGSVYVGVNHRTVQGFNATHKVLRLDRDTGAEVATWDPAGYAVLNRFLVDGPVLGYPGFGTGGGEARIFIWVDAILNEEQHRLLGAVGFSGVDIVHHRWTYPNLSDGLPPKVQGLPAIGYQGRLLVPVNESDLLGEIEGAVALLDPADGEEVDSSVLGQAFEDPVSVATRVGPAYEWTAVIDPLGRGGQVRCDPEEDPSCNGSWDDHEYPASHVGDAAAWTVRYLSVFSDEEYGSVCSYNWALSNVHPLCFDSDPLTAGPVYRRSDDAPLLLAAGSQSGILFLVDDEHSESFSDSLAPLSSPVQSLSLDAEGSAYALLEPDDDGVQVLEVVGFQPESDSSTVHWQMEGLEHIHETVTPILADGGMSDCGQEIGVLYLAADGELHALITDAPPAEGWPNIRGRASRRAAME